MAGHSRIILITDAIETDGDAITAVRAAKEITKPLTCSHVIC